MAVVAPVPVLTILETIDKPSSTFFQHDNASPSASVGASAAGALSLVLGPVYSSPAPELDERTERAESTDGALTLDATAPSLSTSPAPSPNLETLEDAALSDSVAGPSTFRRFTYVGVRRGHRSGVYDSWPEAERQMMVSLFNPSPSIHRDHHDPHRLFGCCRQHQYCAQDGMPASCLLPPVFCLLSASLQARLLAVSFDTFDAD